MLSSFADLFECSEKIKEQSRTNVRAARETVLESQKAVARAKAIRNSISWQMKLLHAKMAVATNIV
jgi:hypothetical protein